jgi:hypothetical protein
MHYPEDEGDNFLRNVCNYLQDYRASQPRTPQFRLRTLIPIACYTGGTNRFEVLQNRGEDLRKRILSFHRRFTKRMKEKHAPLRPHRDLISTFILLKKGNAEYGYSE